MHNRVITATLSNMGKKKPKAPDPPPDPHKGIQINLRIFDRRLLAAVDEYATRVRRSRNMALNILLEQALQGEHLWPPTEE